MKLNKGDLGVMRQSLIVLGIAIFCSLLLIFLSNRQARLAEKNWNDAQMQLRNARSALDNARLDYENLIKFQDEYSAAQERNLIGDEPRLDWVEGLEKLRAQRLVADMHYNIGPQKPYMPQLPINSGNFDIKYSEMKLQLDLLHEAQLLDFFDALRGQIKGWYQLEACNIVRSTDDTKRTISQLHAECNGGWLTLKNRNSAP